MRKRQTKAEIWTLPTLIGIFSLTGLISALVFDNVGNVSSWILLSIPILIILYHCFIYSHQEKMRKKLK